MGVTRLYVLTVAVAVVFAGWLACGGDDPANPGGGGGGGGGNTSGVLALPPGIYELSYMSRVCGETDSLVMFDEGFFCSDEIVDELPDDLPCEIMVDGNTLSVACTTATRQIESNCFAYYIVHATGTASDNVWTIFGTIEPVLSPPGCDSEPCQEFRLTATRTTPMTPTACDYADQGAVESTVSGGPLAGDVKFEAYGSAAPGETGIGWFVNADATTGSASFAKSWREAFSTAQNEHLSLTMVIPELDPAALPKSLSITVGPVGAAQTGTLQGPATVYYSEYRQEPLYGFTATGGTGTIVIQEISPYHVAGTFSMNLSGDESNTNTAVAAQGTRNLNGGFFVGEPQLAGSPESGLTPVADGDIIDGLYWGIKNGVPDNINYYNPTMQWLNGTATQLPWESRAVAEFSLAGITSVSSASLRLWVHASTGPFPIQCSAHWVYGNGRLDGGDWNPNSKMFDFQFTEADSISRWITFDVTSAVQQAVQIGHQYIGFNFQTVEQDIPLNGPFVAAGTSRVTMMDNTTPDMKPHLFVDP